MSNIVVVTNNEVVHEKFSSSYCVEYHADATLLETMEHARDKIHRGHKLLTHPLSGSVKPNDTPYKTIVISAEKGRIDFNGLKFIEESIASTIKFLDGRRTPIWTDKVKADFKLIDYTIISTAIHSMDGKYIG